MMHAIDEYRDLAGQLPTTEDEQKTIERIGDAMKSLGAATDKATEATDGFKERVEELKMMGPEMRRAERLKHKRKLTRDAEKTIKRRTKKRRSKNKTARKSRRRQNA